MIELLVKVSMYLQLPPHFACKVLIKFNTLHACLQGTELDACNKVHALRVGDRVDSKFFILHTNTFDLQPKSTKSTQSYQYPIVPHVKFDVA